MDIQTVCSECVALLVHKELGCDREGAAALVRSALVIDGQDPWPRMELDIFPSGEDTLIVARPAKDMIVTVADYALPFLPDFI